MDFHSLGGYRSPDPPARGSPPNPRGRFGGRQPPNPGAETPQGAKHNIQYRPKGSYICVFLWCSSPMQSQGGSKNLTEWH